MTRAMAAIRVIAISFVGRITLVQERFEVTLHRRNSRHVRARRRPVKQIVPSI